MFADRTMTIYTILCSGRIHLTCVILFKIVTLREEHHMHSVELSNHFSVFLFLTPMSVIYKGRQLYNSTNIYFTDISSNQRVIRQL